MRICLILVVMVLALQVVPADTAVAQKSQRASVPSLGDGEQPLHSGYPKSFDGGGYIDRITKTEIIIDDSLFPLAPNAKFNKPSSRSSSQGSFGAGDFVGILVNADGQVESVWLIKKGKR